MRPLLVILASFVAVACTRTTQQADAAFTAIFRVPVPAGVAVHRGRLWENRHLLVFYEYYALAEFDADAPALDALLRATGKTLTPFDATNFGFGLRDDEMWFAPHDGSSYQGWRSDDGMYVVRSSKSQRVFAYRAEL